MTMGCDLARALDPVALARDAGIEPDPWQAELLEQRPKRCLMLCSMPSAGRMSEAAARYTRHSLVAA